MSSIRALRAELEAEVVAFDADVVSVGDCAELVGQLATIENLAATAKVLAAVRVAKTDLWQGQGDRSAADWLARVCGITVHSAAEQLGLGRKLRERPKTAEAMRRGQLSPEQAKAVTDAAEADAGCEDGLLDLASRGTLKDLRDQAQKARAAAEDDAQRQQRIYARRSLRTYLDGEGAFNLHLRGTAADGARISQVLTPLGELAFARGRAAGVRDSFEARSYDAFLSLINRYLAGTDQPAPSPAPGSVPCPSPGPVPAPDPAAAAPAGSGPVPAPDAGAPEGAPARGEAVSTTAQAAAPAAAGTPSADRAQHDPPAEASAVRGAPSGDRGSSVPVRAGPAPPDPSFPPPVPPAPDRLPGGNHTKLIVRIDHQALRRGHTVAGETCEIVGLGQVPVATVRELLATGDPFLAAVITKGRDVLTVAHLGRGLSAHQRTALEATDLACSNIACNQTVAIQIDHRVPWADDPVTHLANQDPLCPTDHAKKTHHGWSLATGTGRRPFLPPDHPDHPAGPGRTADAGSPARPAGQARQDLPARPDHETPNPAADPAALPRPRPLVEQPKLC